MRPERRNARIADETRKRIIQSFERGEDWQNVALLNGVKVATAYKWLRADEIRYSPLSRGGRRSTLLNEEQIDEMLEWLVDEPSLTLDNLRLRVKAYFDKNISITTISRYLDGRCITLKKLRYLPEGMNSTSNKQFRKQFVLQLMECFQQNRTICWIDETNFNLFCTRTCGRSMKGTRARMLVTNCRGRNVHLIGAMTKDGLIQCQLRRGSYTGMDCKQWIRSLLNHLKVTTPIAQLTVVCDNAPCHSALEDVFHEEEYQGSRLLRLAPYSPMLNPIESAWSVVKSKVKQQLRARFGSISSGDPTGTLSLQDWRMMILEEIINSGLNEVTAEHCDHFVQNALKWCMKAMDNDDM